MAQGTEVPEFERRFGYSEITWEIQNYFAARCKKNWLIESPDFTVKSNLPTKWRMHLMQCWLGEECLVQISLQRLDPRPRPDPKITSPPEEVIAKWFLTFRCDGRDIYLTESKDVFWVNKIACTPIDDIAILENKMLFASSSLFSIRCRMMVYNRDCEIYKITEDMGLKDLSQCMRILYRMHPNSDVIIKIGEDEIEAHKAVVCARNKNLRDKIEEDGDTIEYEDLPVIPKGTAKNLVGYLYTADLNFILRIPSFSMQDLIDFFEMRELQSYFLYDEITIATNFESKVLKFTWLVTENSDNDGVRIRSPLWKLGKLTFQLLLFPKFENNEDKYMSLFGEFGTDSEPDEAYFACAIESTDGSFCVWKGQPWTRGGGKRFGIEKFYYCKSLEDKKAILGHVRIKCTIFIPTGANPTKSVIRCKVNSIVSKNKNQNYIQLSNDLLSLFETGSYSDMTVASTVIRFQAHKEIICCRSRVLKSILSDDNFSGSFYTNDYPPSVLRAFMRYLYSGVMQDHELKDLKKLYSAANNFRILSLKYSCSESLQRNLNAENVLESLVLSHCGKDLKLKYSSMKFLRLNFKKVHEKNDFSVFVDAHPDICMEFIQYLKTCIFMRSGVKLPDDFNIHDYIINIMQEVCFNVFNRT